MLNNKFDASLFEADLYEYIYALDKNNQKDYLKTIYIESLKIIIPMLVSLIFTLISEKTIFTDLDITVGTLVLFSILYSALQISFFCSKKFYNLIYNERSRPEKIKIDKMRFYKQVYKYALTGANLVEELEKNSDKDTEEFVLLVETAIKYFNKANILLDEIIPDEESKVEGKREKNNAVYLYHIGYPELLLLFHKTIENLDVLEKMLQNASCDQVQKNEFNKYIKQLGAQFTIMKTRTESLKNSLNI